MNLLSMHLTRLADFAGREDRQPFWLWTLIVMAASMIGSVTMMIPLMSGIFGRMEQFAREHPDQVTRTVRPGSYSIEVHGYHPELPSDFGGFAIGVGLISLVMIGLLAAAVVRRLHDSGRSGWWGLMPIPFLATGIVVMGQVFTAFATNEPDHAPPPEFFRLFGLLFVNNLIYLLTVITLIVFLAAVGTRGANRYGDDPLPPRQRFSS